MFHVRTRDVPPFSESAADVRRRSQRTKLSNEVVEEVRRLLGVKVFDTLIPRTTRLAEAPSHGQPIIYYDKYSSGAAAYQLLAQEVIVRLAKI